MELLETEFPNYLRNKFDLCGVYIAVYDSPLKIPDEADDDPLAHFDMAGNTCLTFIAEDDSHKFLHR